MEVLIDWMIRIMQFAVKWLFGAELFGYRKNVRWWMAVGYWLACEVGSIMLEDYISSAMPNAIMYFLKMLGWTVLLCEGNWKKKVMLSAVYVTMVFGIELLIVLLFEGAGIMNVGDIHYTQKGISNLALLSENLILTFVIRVAGIYIKRRREEGFIGKYWKYLLTMPALCSFIMLFLGSKMLRAGVFFDYDIIILIVIMIMDLLSYYFYIELDKKNKYEMESKVYQMQADMYRDWYDKIRQNDEEMSAVRHDIKNHMAAIGRMCLKGYEEEDKGQALKNIEAYIAEIGIKLGEKRKEIDTGNIAIDAIINFKMAYAEAQGIEWKIHANIPKDLDLDATDIVILMGNILDNAIEACQRIEGDRWIDIALKYGKGKGLVLTVKNTYDGGYDSPDLDNITIAMLKTSKSDKKAHGIGLKNVRTVADKYEGEILISANGNVFEVSVILCIK